MIEVGDIIKGKIDLLSLDTEGFDKKILESWPWEKVKPRVICVENDPGEILTNHGYRQRAKTRDNLIYVLVN